MRRQTTAIGAALVIFALSGCGGGSSALPTATTARFPDLGQLVQWAKSEVHINSVGPLKRAMVFSTTRLAANRAGTGANPSPPDGRVEVVVLQGEFVCRTCHGPRGSVIRGRVITLVFPTRGGTDLSVGNGLPGSQMGTAYSLPLD